MKEFPPGCNQWFNLKKIKLPTYRSNFKVKLNWSTNKVNMKTKELSKEDMKWWRSTVQERVRRRFQSLIIPLSTVKSIMKKWKMCYTVTNLEAICTQQPVPAVQLFR